MTNTITHFSGIIIQRLRISSEAAGKYNFTGQQSVIINLAVYAGIEFKELGIVVTIPLRPITNQRRKISKSHL